MTDTPIPAPEVIRIPNAPLPVVRQPASYDDVRGTGTPLIIDNGSTNMRFGFATSSSPVSVPNVISKFRDRKQNRPLLLMGDAVDIESAAKSQARYAWEGDILLNFDALVSVRSLFTPRTESGIVIQCATRISVYVRFGVLCPIPQYLASLPYHIVSVIQ